MFDVLFIGSIIGGLVEYVKEHSEPVIPAENWANKKLYNDDIANGVSVEQRIKNAENGKYKIKNVYPEPHKDANGDIIIENSQLYYDDLINYGAYQTQQWVKQGKYNLSKEELKKEEDRIKEKLKYLCNL